MLSSLLIANRGEIAVRIARTAASLGVRTVAVHSDADRDSPHVRVADEAVRIGPASAAESYLDIRRVLEAARKTGVEAIHPGYGFLSENADFAEACRKENIVFVGPPPAAIRAMGLKDEAKRIMDEAGVPTVPGYRGDNQDASFLKRKAYEIGYPVLIKAVAGGGGKGMRRVDKALAFEDALAAAKREAKAAFGNDRVLLERYVTNPRHIEVQVFADSRDDAVHLGERDCSLQRRHQKVVEEAPAPGLTADQRMTMGKAACDAALAVGYRGAGTVEFIVDGSNLDEFFFMEMNTRLQVEHPVTEMITGLDLVEWQLRIASGEPLPLRQDEVRLDGHAVEARLYAEDPGNDFLPSTGKLHRCRFPTADGVRVDSGVAEGFEVSAHYDPMIAKIIAHAPTRDEALDRLDDALAQTLVAGPRTNLAFLRALLAHDDFRSGAFSTQLVDRDLRSLTEERRAGEGDIAAAANAFLAMEREENARRASALGGDKFDPWSDPDLAGFRIGAARAEWLDLVADGTPLRVDLPVRAEGGVHAVRADGDVLIVRDGLQFRFERFDPSVAGREDGGAGAIRAPMTGKVITVTVEPDQHVRRGETLFAVEAMKMEHAVAAPVDARVASVAVREGDQVTDATVCVVLEPQGGPD